MNLTEEYQVAPFVHSNSSCMQTSAADVLLYISAAVVVSLTMCGNLLVIISICHFRQLQTPTNFLLLSLAMADFLVGVTVMPLHFTMLMDPERCFGIFFCTTLIATSYYFTCISNYSIALISVDRCFCLSNPFYYSMKMTVNLTVRIIAILWLCSFIYSAIMVYFMTDTDMKNITCVECFQSGYEEWSVIDIVVFFVLPFSIIIIMYLKIFAIAKKHANKIRSDRKSQKTANIGSLASERKAAKSIGILVAVFLLCLVPYYVSLVFEVYLSNRSVQLAISITLTLLYLNSSFNPIIYALLYPWFLRSVKLILTLRICGTYSSFLNVLGQDT